MKNEKKLLDSNEIRMVEEFLNILQYYDDLYPETVFDKLFFKSLDILSNYDIILEIKKMMSLNIIL